MVLSFGGAGKAGRGGGDRWRQKLGGSWGCGRFTFRVYTKRMQEELGNESDVCQHGCKDDKVGEVRVERASDGGVEEWIEEGVEERRGTGKTGVEGSSL